MDRCGTGKNPSEPMRLPLDSERTILIETNGEFLIELCRPIDWKSSYDRLEDAHNSICDFLRKNGREEEIVPFKRPEYAKKAKECLKG